MSTETLEVLKLICEIGSVVLLFFTFVFGAGAWYFGREFNERQSAKLKSELQEKDAGIGEAKADAASAKAKTAAFEKDNRDLRIDLENQRAATAEAERKAVEAQRGTADTKRQVSDRHVKADAPIPKTDVTEQVWVDFIGGDGGEARRYASQIVQYLVQAGFDAHLVIAERLANERMSNPVAVRGPNAKVRADVIAALARAKITAVDIGDWVNLRVLVGPKPSVQ